MITIPWYHGSTTVWMSDPHDLMTRSNQELKESWYSHTDRDYLGPSLSRIQWPNRYVNAVEWLWEWFWPWAVNGLYQYESAAYSDNSDNEGGSTWNELVIERDVSQCSYQLHCERYCKHPSKGRCSPHWWTWQRCRTNSLEWRDSYYVYVKQAISFSQFLCWEVAPIECEVPSSLNVSDFCVDWLHVIGVSGAHTESIEPLKLTFQIQWPISSRELELNTWITHTAIVIAVSSVLSYFTDSMIGMRCLIRW